MTLLDYSQIYHYVRGESTLKLYVLYNMLEVFYKLCCAVGQDVQDAMYFSATDAMKTKKYIPVIVTFAINTVFLFVHTIVQFFRVVTLNVALNSSNNALVTLLMANNFVELKGSVFKRSGKEALFQIGCHG
jgi:hypothetical protein